MSYIAAKFDNFLRNAKWPQSLYHKSPRCVQNVFLNARAIPLVWTRYSRDTYQCLEILLDRDSWSEKDLQAYVEGQEKEVYSLAHNIPFYAKQIQGKFELRDFSILEREHVRGSPSEFLNPSEKGIVKVHTSGTTGSGLPVYYDKEAYILNWAYVLKHRCWAGVDFRTWRITLFGPRVVAPERVDPPFWRKNLLEKQYLVSIFNISDRVGKYYAEFFEKHQGIVVEGFPSVLYLVARYIRGYCGKLKFKAVFTTGEPLQPFMREEIEEVFGAKIFDAYGMTEYAGLIMECPQGGYHVLSDYGRLEIVDDLNQPVPNGTEGYMIWTGFINHMMPFIRYKIGDKGILLNEKCTCGRPYPLARPTITRDSDYLRLPSGRILSPRAISPLFKDKKAFMVCQIVQPSIGEIVLRVVPDRKKSEFLKSDLKESVCALKLVTGNELLIHEEVSEAPLRRGTQGKIPFIVSSLN